MQNAVSRMKRNIERMKNRPVAEMMEMFENIVQLPENFGNPIRTRLFSPLYYLLALSVPGPLG